MTSPSSAQQIVRLLLDRALEQLKEKAVDDDNADDEDATGD